MAPFETLDAGFSCEIDVSLDIRPIEVVDSLGCFFNFQQLRRNLIVVESGGEERDVEDILAMFGDIFKIRLGDTPKAIVEKFCFIEGDQTVGIEPMGDGEVFARPDFQVMDTASEVADVWAAERFRKIAVKSLEADDDVILAGFAVGGRGDGKPECLFLGGAESIGIVVEKRVGNHTGDFTPAVVIGEILFKRLVIIRDGDETFAADASGPTLGEVDRSADADEVVRRRVIGAVGELEATAFANCQIDEGESFLGEGIRWKLANIGRDDDALE